MRTGTGTHRGRGSPRPRPTRLSRPGAPRPPTALGSLWGALSAGGRSLHPRATSRASRGRRCLSTCSEDHMARQQQATPHPTTGADLGLRAPGQARRLVLPAGQTGRHKRRRQDRGGQGTDHGKTRKTDRRMDPGWTQRQVGPRQAFSPSQDSAPKVVRENLQSHLSGQAGPGDAQGPERPSGDQGSGTRASGAPAPPGVPSDPPPAQDPKRSMTGDEDGM